MFYFTIFKSYQEPITDGLLILYENVSDMTQTAHAYVAIVNILELPCPYACAYLTSENQA